MFVYVFIVPYMDVEFPTLVTVCDTVLTVVVGRSLIIIPLSNTKGAFCAPNTDKKAPAQA